MRVADAPFASIDFESAGTAPGLTDEPVQVAVAHWENGHPVVVLNSLLKPSRPVTWSAREVHGIDDRALASAPVFLDMWPRLKPVLEGRWIVAHGAATEKRFLRAFPLHGFGPWVDTLPLVRAAHPGLASHALSSCIASLGLEGRLDFPGFRWHDAASDATATLLLLDHIIRSNGIANEPAEILTRPSLRSYFAHRMK